MESLLSNAERRRAAGLALRLARRSQYGKVDVARALAEVLVGREVEGEIWNDATVDFILGSLGVRRVRLEGMTSALADSTRGASIIAMTHFYGPLDAFLLYRSLRGFGIADRLFFCGRGNTLNRIRVGRRSLGQAFGERFVRFEQNERGEIDLLTARREVDERLSRRRVMVISCVSQTQPLTSSADANGSVALENTGAGFAYFATRSDAPVYSATILLRAPDEAIVSFAGPFAKRSGTRFADVRLLADEVIRATESRLRGLLAEEQSCVLSLT